MNIRDCFNMILKDFGSDAYVSLEYVVDRHKNRNDIDVTCRIYVCDENQKRWHEGETWDSAYKRYATHQDPSMMIDNQDISKKGC